jgi:alpha-L-fucosidase 2
MQMDATMGFLIAVTELLVQNRHDGIYVLPKLPRRWKTLRFDGIRTEGAFLVGATVENGKTSEVRVKAEKGGRLRLHPGFGDVAERDMAPGEEFVLRP